MRQFCPLGCSPCLIHHWMFYSIQPGRLCGRCPDCGGACPAVGAHIIFREQTVCRAAGGATRKMKFVEDCGPMRIDCTVSRMSAHSYVTCPPPQVKYYKAASACPRGSKFIRSHTSLKFITHVHNQIKLRSRSR